MAEQLTLQRPTITILVGCPGSGKSTYANDMINNDGDHGAATVRVSQDDQGKAGHMEVFARALANKQDIIVDRMNFDKAQRNRYLEPAKKAGYNTVIVVFHVPMATCLERCNARTDHPTIKDSKSASQAVNFFFCNYERVSDDEANLVKRRGWIVNGPKAVVCDLDGTLCNVEHRRHFVRPPEGVKKNWPAFFAGIPNDTVNEACEALLRSMALSGHEIVYCSGRGDNERKATVEWLNKFGLDLFYSEYRSFDRAPLYMRGRHDSRRDDIVKEIILDFEILTRYTPVFMIDDRDQVVAMWRRRGFTCLQIDYGDF
jgi:adenylate kinase family enzyme